MQHRVEYSSSEEEDEILYQPSLDVQCRKRPAPELPTVSQSAPIETQNPFVQRDAASAVRVSKGPSDSVGFSSRRRSQERGTLVGATVGHSPVADPFGTKTVMPPRFLSSPLSPLHSSELAPSSNQPDSFDRAVGAPQVVSTGGGLWGSHSDGARDGTASWGTTNNPFCVGNPAAQAAYGLRQPPVGRQAGFGSASPETDRFNALH